MTVRELIEKLQKFPQDMIVEIGYEGVARPARSAEIEELGFPPSRKSVVISED